MWYRIDIMKLAVQLLPPVLRCVFTVALLRVLTLPLRYVQGLFAAYMAEVSGRLNITAGVQYIEKALNDAFYLTDGQIYIESVMVSSNSEFFRLETEGMDAQYIGTEGETPFYMYHVTDTHPGDGVNFNVYVPTFLCTSLNAGEDKYDGENLRRIRSLIDYYKPAGRKYGIILYDYE